MADKKISALTAATTPLAGTEVLPIVQSSTTVKVAVSDLTAGRAVSATSFAPTGSSAPANGVYLPATNSVGIATNSAERVRIDSVGNVGIGGAPSSWATYPALQAGVGGFMGAGSDLNVSANAYFNAGWKYTTTGAATLYNHSAGVHSWYYAASGTAGTAITWTQSMTLDTSGNLRLNGSTAELQLAVGAERTITPSGASGSTALTFKRWNGASYVNDVTMGSDGNLGLGIASVSGYRLYVQTTAGPYVARYNNSSTSTSDYCVIQIGQGAAGSALGYLGTGGSTTANAYFQNNFVIGTQSNNAVVFNMNDIERMRIDTSANFLFGTTNASSTGGIGIKFVASATNPFSAEVCTSTTSSHTTYHLYSTGASAYRFYVNGAGTINATSTTISAISDIRFKENIRDLEDGLDILMRLKPRRFDWKPGKGKDIKNDRGWIAQEFEQVLPEMIGEWKDPAPEGEEPYKSVQADLIPILVKAIQELNAKVAALEAA